MPLFTLPPTIAVQVGARNLAGFTNTNTDTTITWTNGTRTISIAPTGTKFTVWANNTGYTFTGSQSTVIANVVGQHYVIFDATGALTSSTTPWDITTDQAAPVATVYWDGTNGAVADERHSAQRDRWNHRDLHNTRGTAYQDGLAGSFNNANFSVAPGNIYDEELKLILPNTYTTCRLWYRKVGATQMTFESAVANVYKASGTSLQYDNAGTLTTVTTNGGGNYVTNWIYATDDIAYPIYCVVSQAQYTTLANARAATSPTFPNLTTREWKLIYTVIYRNPAGVAAFIEATDYRTVSTLPGAVVTSLPAASVTFTPIPGITAGNVQVAFAQVAPLTSGIADGATAVGVTFNTAATYSTAGAKLLSLQNNSVEKTYIDKDGNGTFNTVYVGLGLADIATNTAVGYQTLTANTTGYENTAVGYQALQSVTTAYDCVAVGHIALQANTTGEYNTAVGRRALFSNTIGTRNTAVGTQALQYNVVGNRNTAIGRQAMYNFGNPFDVTSRAVTIGFQYIIQSTGTTDFTVSPFGAGDSNPGTLFTAVATGTAAGDGLVAPYGEYNIAVGVTSLPILIEGWSNTAIGQQSGNGLQVGSFNVFIGDGANTGSASPPTTNMIVIGANTQSFWGESNTTTIGDFFNTTKTLIAGIAWGYKAFGLVNGGTLSNDIYVMDRYTEMVSDAGVGDNSHAVSLLFGGTNSGMTYSVDRTESTAVGNIFIGSLRIVLTNKGSSTGNATITGMSAIGNPLIDTPCTVWADGVTSGGNAVIQAYIDTAGVINLSQLPSNGVLANLTHANFSNTSTIMVQCSFILPTI